MRQCRQTRCGTHVALSSRMRAGRVGLQVALMATAACYSTFDLSAQSVQALNGFHEGERRTIATTQNESVVFDRDTILSFHDQGGEPVYVASLRTESGVEVDRSREREARFSAIAINGPHFDGTTQAGEHLVLDLRQLTVIQAKKPSALKTTLAIVIPCVLVTALAVVIFFPACQATTCFGTM